VVSYQPSNNSSKNSPIVNITSTLSPDALAALDKVEPLPNKLEPLGERILDAFGVAQAYAAQIQDDEHRLRLERRLSNSGVHGSMVLGLNGADDVAAVISQVTDWEPVVVTLKDAKIMVFQGKLPEQYRAYTAYASVREIAQTFGIPGVSTIQTKIGHQNDDEYYHCTMLRMPTSAITVQLRPDESGVEHLHLWFAGVELSSRLRRNDGDNIVRCGVVIQPITSQSQRPAKMGGQPGNGRYARSNRDR